MTARVVTVVQARTASTRLPGKVLLPLLGRTVLEHQIERIRRASLAGTVIVATTTDLVDDGLVDVCERAGIPVYRGHPTDLLDRHVAAARACRATHVVKIPSDCPLIDPAVIDRVLGYALANDHHFDYVGNLHPASWPDGNDVEVVRLPMLEEARRLARKPHEREHTTPFLWDRPELYRIGSVVWETGRDLSMSHRFTLDYPEDFAFITAVYEALHPGNPAFSLHDILALLEARPDLASLNAHLGGVNWYRHHLNELRTVDASRTRQLEVA